MIIDISCNIHCMQMLFTLMILIYNNSANRAERGENCARQVNN